MQTKTVAFISFVGAILLRIAVIVYSTWHDKNFLVKYTDIDYFVYTDASRFVAQGLSPYMRSTYRYTPLLAYMLLPNIHLYDNFGKVLFCLSDLLVAVLLFSLLNHSSTNKHKQASMFNIIVTCVFVLFNPITTNTSTRGNADQLVVLLVFLCMKVVINGGSSIVAGVLYGLSVHFKIYPLIYGPIVMIYYTFTQTSGDTRTRRGGLFRDPRILFCLSGGIVLVVLTAVFYELYGYQFLYESYLYHVTRSDHRHNFSVYFYQMYLNSGRTTPPDLIDKGLAILAFLPQIGLLLLYYGGLCYLLTRKGANTPENLSQLTFVTMFLVTFVFVMFNKVCTVQYFIWYMALLAFVVQRVKDLNPKKQFTKRSLYTSIILVVAWMLGQGLWLSQGYALEFLGQQVFLRIWGAGLLFFVINLIILCIVTASTFTHGEVHLKEQ